MATPQRTLTIAHVLQSFEIGGGERVALGLAERQRAEGHRVLALSITAPPDGPLAADFAARGVETRRLPKRAGFDWTMPPRLLAFFLRQRVSVVHTHNPMTLIYASVAAKGARAAVVHTKHGEAPEIARRMRLRRLAASFVDGFVHVSAETASFSHGSGEAPNGRSVVITNGVDCDRFKPDGAGRQDVRAALGIPAGAFVLGSVGRLQPVKCPTVIVRALLPLLADQLRLVIVGDGPEEDAVRALLAADERGKFVHMVGRRGDVERLMASFDAFILASSSEGLPLVVLEAMASGLPVVASAVGGVPALIAEGETGHLIPAGDEQALRQRVQDLHTAPERARQMGQRGRDHVAQCYSAERMANEYMALYRKLCTRGRWL